MKHFLVEMNVCIVIHL